MKRVAYICADPGVPVFGRKGCSVHVQEVIRSMQRCGCDVELFALNVKGERPDDLVNLRVHEIGGHASGSSGEVGGAARKAEDREAILLAMNDHVSELLEASGPFDMVYERYALWSFAAMEWAARHAVPGLLEVNSPLIQEQVRYRILHDRAGAERASERAFAAASLILPVSQEVAQNVGSLFDGKRVCVLPNGVNVDRITPDVKPARPQRMGTTTIGFIGTLKPWHGVDGLIRSAAGLTGVRVLIVGDGPERARLESLAANLRFSSSSVEFTGSVDPSDIPAFLTSMDIAAAPYPELNDFYFSPLKILEYMAAGRAIVASDIGQISSTLTHEYNALLHAPGDLVAMRNHLQRLVNDSDLRLRLGRQARIDADQHHSWDGVVQRVLASQIGSHTEACA